MTGASVSVQGLVKRYDRRAVVAGLSFEVEPGSIFALLGPNGAGKTTTVEILEGYRCPDGGTVRVLGLDPARDGTALRGRLGLMLQGGGIYPQARPRELVRLYARFYARPRDPDELLEVVGLSAVANARYKVLSGGEKQRLALALALVGRPELVVLDEPTAGMDPAAKAATRDLIASLRRDGVTVLLTTHELGDVERLADRVALIANGRLIAIGSTAELMASAFPRLRFRLAVPLSGPDRQALIARIAETAPRATLAEDGGSGRYRLDGVPPSPELITRLAAWCAVRGALIVELRAGGGSLEERYLELVAEAEGSEAAQGPAS